MIVVEGVEQTVIGTVLYFSLGIAAVGEAADESVVIAVFLLPALLVLLVLLGSEAAVHWGLSVSLATFLQAPPLAAPVSELQQAARLPLPSRVPLFDSRPEMLTVDPAQ